MLVYSANHLTPESSGNSDAAAVNQSIAQAATTRSPAQATAAKITKAAQPSADKVDFTRDIKPIFEAACYACHAGEKAQAELRLDVKAAALKGGVSGSAIISGNSKDSLLVKRVVGHSDLGARMPPAGDPLTTQQIALLRRWIDQGAAWPDTAIDASPEKLLAQQIPATAGKGINFARDIQPILQASCYQCHAGERPKGQLRLDSKNLALQGGISGKVIVPGSSKDSRLIHRVLGLGDEQRMPLKGTPLSEQSVKLLSSWIDQGAAWPDDSSGGGESATAKGTAKESKLEKHWAYVKPVRPEPPPVKNTSWVRNPVDNFVLAKLESEGLAPSHEASREALIRRLSLDLTGLPPSVREVDEFVSDRNPDAYEKLVDRLLASPHYGERWARPWLDLARYADTNGYEKDKRRVMWKYRDWVINALNQDMPFDRFTIEQIAGDMLPAATADQKIASGFHRNATFNEEGGVDQEEARYETVVDRVNTTTTVWLGSTLGCAQCHNHKYDPFTQKDYYRFYAFFNNTDYHFEGDAKISEQKLIEPRFEMPTAEQQRKRQAIEMEAAQLKQLLQTGTSELEAAQAVWEREATAASAQWTMLDPTEVASTGGATLTKSVDKSVVVSGANSGKDTYVIEARTGLKGVTGIRLEALPDPSLPRGGPGRDQYGNFVLNGFAVEASTASDGAQAAALLFQNAVADDSVGSLGATDNSKYEFKNWTVNAAKDDARLARQAIFVAAQPFGFDGETVLKIKLTHASAHGGQSIGRFRLSVTTATDPTIIASVPVRLRSLLAVPPAKRTAEQKKDLADHYRSVAPQLKPTRDRLAELRKASEGIGVVTALVMQERPLYERPSTHLRIRGSYTNKGEQVYAGVPAVLHPLPESQLSNRLGLAHWLVDKDNPLVARVTVNRFWEQIFGRGIVETSEDFGAQGAPPTHPELLDWLATEFIERGWSIKRMHRLIVTSAAYRQSSKVTPSLLERDPHNKLLTRGPRFRMEAEMLRDAALAASGQLSRKIGGPSVFPLQPDGIWDIPYSSDKWTNSEGEDRYRRGLYTFLRRTSPYPALMTFDAPSREFCTVRRVRTNTPLQALTTLNDPAFFDAARSLAKRIWAEAAPNTRERAVHGFRLCVSRPPTAVELNRVVAAYEKELQFFSKDVSAAGKTAGDKPNLPASSTQAEIAAWTVISNILLNLDEALTKQ